MKLPLCLGLCLVLWLACGDEAEVARVEVEDWSARAAVVPVADSLLAGKSYLSIYSQIHSSLGDKVTNLTAMVSLRNTSEADTIYLTLADYFDTHGQLVKRYVASPIFLAPLETVEIIIAEADIRGGTGSNFIFGWQIPPDCPEPLFEAIMSSTVWQQGLSFTTQGRRIQ